MTGALLAGCSHLDALVFSNKTGDTISIHVRGELVGAGVPPGSEVRTEQVFGSELEVEIKSESGSRSQTKVIHHKDLHGAIEWTPTEHRVDLNWDLNS